jgi:hypothetical protein
MNSGQLLVPVEARGFTPNPDQDGALPFSRHQRLSCRMTGRLLPWPE